MAKVVQLTIKTNYLPSWGLQEGIRELMQNARDAEVDGYRMTVDWYNDKLRIENEGTTLPLRSLLFGETTKEGRADQIGKFGEGLKLAILALIRIKDDHGNNIHDVKIRSGSSVWTASIERSDIFDEMVLTIRVDEGRKPENRVRIEIDGISKRDWESMKWKFLFLTPPGEGEEIKTSYGSLLLGPKYKGKVFVKGLYVQTVHDLEFGYDLKDAELDRDRKMVESWDLGSRTKNILLEALTRWPIGLNKFVALLNSPTTEVETLNSWDHIPDTVAAYVAKDFKDTYGENAFPVTSLEASKSLEHLGMRGVVVPRQLANVLCKTFGDASKVTESLKKEVTKTYSWSDLDDEEKQSLIENISLMNDIELVTLDIVDVVDFRSPELQGQFKDERILIARKYLKDRFETLSILIHELAHRKGGDGDKSHVSRIEHMWRDVHRKVWCATYQTKKEKESASPPQEEVAQPALVPNPPKQEHPEPNCEPFWGQM